MNGQEERTSTPTPIMEVDAYLSYLRSADLSSRNSSASRLEKLLKEVQPGVYYLQGQVRNYGENPTALYTSVGSLRDVASVVASRATIEIVTIYLNQSSDLNSPIDLSLLSSFPNLKYVYIMSTVETSAAAITQLVRNSNPSLGVFYKIDKGS